MNPNDPQDQTQPVAPVVDNTQVQVPVEPVAEPVVEAPTIETPATEAPATEEQKPEEQPVV